ncbi:hypothetical protein SAMN05660666_02276 [Novosphingobium aromaticivorans]|nr:hypothetical protein SAMN05660666_02276 [Novosphingobium aromaticivorans]
MFCALAALTGSPLFAQDNGAAMAEVVRQLRLTADRMEGQLPASDIADMRRQADDLERENKLGAFSASSAPPVSKRAAERIAAEHGGRLDWLDQHPACVGYGWENYRTFRLASGDRDAERDVLCQRAFGNYAAYMAGQRAGDFAGSDALREAYDKAAHAAVDFFERRTGG